MSLDLDKLQKKEIEFDYVASNKLSYINKIDVLETTKIKLENLTQRHES